MKNSTLVYLVKYGLLDVKMLKHFTFLNSTHTYIYTYIYVYIFITVFFHRKNHETNKEGKLTQKHCTLYQT